jgi:hypothetical protein
MSDQEDLEFYKEYTTLDGGPAEPRKIQDIIDERDRLRSLMEKGITEWASTLEVNPGTVVLIKIPVGQMPAQHINTFLADIAESFKDHEVLHGRTFYLPERDNGVGPKFEALDGTGSSTLVMKIPTSDIPKKDVPQFLSEMRNSISIPEGFTDVICIPLEVEVSIQD